MGDFNEAEIAKYALRTCAHCLSLLLWCILTSSHPLDNAADALRRKLYRYFGLNERDPRIGYVKEELRIRKRAKYVLDTCTA